MNEWFPATRPQLDPETIIRGGIPVIPSDLGTPFNPNHLKVAWDFKMPKDFAIQPLPLPEDDPLRTLYTNQGIVPDEAIRSQIDIALRPEFQKPITDPPQPNWIHETIYSPTDGFLPAVKNWWDDIINPKINTTSGLIPTKGTIEISKLHPHEFGYNPRTVDELTSILEKGKTLDPVKITEYNGQLYTYDGANRVTVYARSGQEQVPYIFTKFDSLSDLDRLLIETASTGNYGVYQFPKKYGADFPISPIQSTRDSNYIDESWFQQTTYSPTDGFLPAVKNWWDNSPINWKNRDIGLGGSPAMDPSNTDQVINKPNQIHWSADIGKATDSIVNTVRYPTHNSLENFLPINLVVVASLPLISDNPILLVPVSILTAFQSQQIYKMRQNMIVFGDDLLVEPTKNFKKVSITSNYQGSSVTSNIDHNTLIGELHVGTWQSLQKYKGMNKFEAAVQMQSTLMSSVIDLGHAVKNNDPRIKDIEVFYGVSNIIKGSFEKYGFMVKPYQTSPFKKQLHLTAVRLVHLRSEGLGGVFYSPLEIFRNVMNGGISEFKIFKEMDDLKEVYITKEALINALPQLERDYQRILDRFQLK